MMVRWGMLLLAGTLISCSSDDGGGGAASCPQIQPIQCKDNGGAVLGCCPLDHPVCSADGTQCLEGSGGSGGTGGSSASGGSGNTGNGGSSASGGSTNGGTGGVGGSGAVGGSSGGAGGSGGTGGTPVPCDDVGFEPNETEATATDLGSLSDCDGPGENLSAKLDTEADVDFYVYDGSDGACVVDPSVSTTDAVRVCLFADCSGVSASCTAGTSSTLDGLPGCCVDGPGTVTVDVNCSGLFDDATMYIRIDQGAAGVCTDYSLDYHY